MNPLRAPEHGEVVKLGPPASGEVIITVDPSTAGTTFAAGTQTLRPGAEMPVHKHLDWDTVLFVYKGQGRVTLHERIINVVPGAMLHVPRGVWYGVRNTGTGAFQIAWVSAPPGLEALFRDLSRMGDVPSAQALQELAQRHRIEFRQAADALVPAGRRRHERRGGRRDRGGGRQPSGWRHSLAGKDSSGSVAGRRSAPPAASPSAPQATPAPAPVEPSAAPSALPAAPSAPRGPRRRRHRRGGGRRSGGSVAGRRSTPPVVPQKHHEEAGGTPPISAPASTAPGSSRPGTGRQPSVQRNRSRRVKEVYMGGQWVRIEGEGPAIAPGSSWPRRRGPKRDGDGEPPGVPLSVPL